MGADKMLKKPNFIKPSILVEAIYGLNNMKNLTPDFFEDTVLYGMTKDEYDFDDYDIEVPSIKKKKIY